MRDIFNILKHEGHNLDIIKEFDEYKLGCLDCGITLYEIEDIDLHDFLEVIRICEEKNFNLKNKLIEFLKLSIYGSPDDLSKKINNSIRSKIDDLMDGGRCINFHRSTLLHEITNGILTRNASQADKIKVKKILDMDSTDELLYETAISQLKRRNDIIVLEKGDKYVSSNRFYINRHDYYVTILNKSLLEKEELENPSETEKIEINTASDFYKIKPSYDDEDEDTEEYRDFEFRSYANLYDFSNMTKEEAIKLLTNGLNIFFDYDYNTRNAIQVLQALKALGIDLKDSQYSW